MLVTRQSGKPQERLSHNTTYSRLNGVEISFAACNVRAFTLLWMEPQCTALWSFAAVQHKINHLCAKYAVCTYFSLLESLTNVWAVETWPALMCVHYCSATV